MKKIEICIVSQGRYDDNSLPIRKTLYKGELTNQEGSLKEIEVIGTCRNITGCEVERSCLRTDVKNKTVYSCKINDRMSVVAYVDD